MDLKSIVETVDLEVKAGEDRLDREVQGGYVSDLLSDVIANSRKGDLWVTLQIHQNTVAVAVLKELAGIVIIGGKEPTPETLKKAEEECVVVLTSALPAFELAGRLYELGVRGTR
jgi:predicted transcriptional regulator